MPTGFLFMPGQGRADNYFGIPRDIRPWSAFLPDDNLIHGGLVPVYRHGVQAGQTGSI